MRIPLSVPNIKGNELKYITTAVETEWVSTAGPYISDFENKIAEYVGSKGAVSCQNGTAGLHMALKSCGVDYGDEVIVPTLTFIAAINPVKYLGAEPIFMDCDDTLTMDPEKLQEFCRTQCELSKGQLINKKTKRTIKAVLVVHVFGNMANMEKLMNLCHQFGLSLIEDATEALGSYYTKGKYQGKFAGTIGDVGVYSFNGNKIITTGGGGMIVSNNKERLQTIKHWTTQAKSDELYFIHDEVGYNYRMTNLQAAMGLGQLEQLETFIETKKTNYLYYKEHLRKVEGLTVLDFENHIRSNYWFYSLDCSDFVCDRDAVIQYLAKHNIQTRPIWGLIHEQKPYQDCQSYRIEKASHYYNSIVNIPCSSNLTTEQIDQVVECIAQMKEEHYVKL